MDLGVDLFVDTATAYCQVVDAAAELPLAQRVETLAGSLAGLIATALHLPPSTGAPPPRSEPAAPPAWPGLGTFERAWRLPGPYEQDEPVQVELSADLLAVRHELQVGLDLVAEGRTEDALASWRHGFETSWGPRAVDGLAALHRALCAFREAERAERQPEGPEPLPDQELVLLAPPEDDEPPIRPMLGVRVEPAVIGVEVTAVHPSGPTHGLLEPGDLLLAVDGVSLDGRTADEAGLLLVGPVGIPRALQVYREGETHEVEVVPADPRAILEEYR